MEECKKKRIKIITPDDPAYPRRFNGLPGMPCVLYARGCLRINAFEKAFGIVGARRCSDVGKQSAIKITCDAVKKGSAIVSGMAKGVDSYAHTAALKNEGYTIAVSSPRSRASVITLNTAFTISFESEMEIPVS